LGRRELGCNRLVLALRTRVERLRPGAIIEVQAVDPGAPIDLPAWCRMTGHELVSANPPIYRIRRRDA